MKAITLWQPWASLIADGRKTIETRSRPWSFIGPIAIHASKYADPVAMSHFYPHGGRILPLGAVVAVAIKINCVKLPSMYATPDEYGDFTFGRYGYVLANTHKLSTPSPVSGKQGIWEWSIDPSLADELLMWGGEVLSGKDDV